MQFFIKISIILFSGHFPFAGSQILTKSLTLTTNSYVPFYHYCISLKKIKEKTNLKLFK